MQLLHLCHLQIEPVMVGQLLCLENHLYRVRRTKNQQPLGTMCFIFSHSEKVVLLEELLFIRAL